MDLYLHEKDPTGIAVFSLIVLWTIFWKGLALWQAARRGSRGWFVVILIVSTLGILEIIYLFFILKLKVHDVFRKGEKIKEEPKQE